MKADPLLPHLFGLHKPGSALAFVLGLMLCSGSALGTGEIEYIVRPGDNPWNISTRFLKHINYWPRLQQHNQIRQPTKIPPGTRLRIPLAWLGKQAASVQVAAVVGEVEYEYEGEHGQVQAGSLLHGGTLVRTRAQSSLKLRFADGSHSLIGANTEFHLRELTQLKLEHAPQVHIDLRQGLIESSVRPTQRWGTRFQIDTPAAIAAVRGTEFRVRAQGEKMQTEAVHGAVLVNNPHGHTYLPAGSGTTSARSQAPEQARPLLAAPALTHLPAVIHRLPFSFPVAAVAGAQSYRSIVRPKHEDAPPVSNLVSTTAVAQGSAELENGIYLLQLRAIDGDGLEGLNAEQEILVHAHPEPPFLLSPPAHAAITEDQIHFRWAKIADARSYHFEFAEEAGFAAPLASIDHLDATRLNLAAPSDDGNYYWRVAVTTEQGRGPWSDPQPLARPPAGPELDLVEAKDDALQLRWQGSAAAVGYQIQLSRSADFSPVEREIESTHEHADIPALDSGSWHVRVRPLYADAHFGRWGKAQQIEIPPNHWRALWLLLPFVVGL